MPVFFEARYRHSVTFTVYFTLKKRNAGAFSYFLTLDISTKVYTLRTNNFMLCKLYVI